MKLKKIEHLCDYRFELTFENGECIVADLAELIASHVGPDELISARSDPDWGAWNLNTGKSILIPKRYTNSHPPLINDTPPEKAFIIRTPFMPKLIVFIAFLFMANSSHAETIGCVTTTWKLIGANHKICVDAFADPKIPGVTCHVSQAKTGGISGAFGVAQDPSQFSLACRQTGPISLPDKLPDDEEVFSEGTSLLFKETRVMRLWDKANNTLVYLAISRKLIDGAPANSISTVPVMPWGNTGK